MPRSLWIFLLVIFSLRIALPASGGQEKHGPLTEGAIINLLHGGVAPERIASLAQEYGIAFRMTPAIESDLRTAGATETLIQTLRGLTPKTVAPRPTKQEPAAPKRARQEPGQISHMWHSVGTLYDFRVQMTNDLFHAEWVNIPPADGRQGAYIRTDCRRKGTKWVGSSNANLAFPLRKVRGEKIPSTASSPFNSRWIRFQRKKSLATQRVRRKSTLTSATCRRRPGETSPGFQSSSRSAHNSFHVSKD